MMRGRARVLVEVRLLCHWNTSWLEDKTAASCISVMLAICDTAAPLEIPRTVRNLQILAKLHANFLGDVAEQPWR